MDDLHRPAPATIDWPRIPYVGVGCVVVHGGRLLLVRGRRGLWAPPGGHLDFGESPEQAAVRETKEETDIDVTDIEFLAITNDVLTDVDRHYITIWMRGTTRSPAIAIHDTDEIVEAGWFDLAALPSPRFLFFDNLLAGRTLPALPPDGFATAPGREEQRS